MSRRNGRVAVWCGIVTLCIAGTVFAHAGAVLDLEGLEAYIAQQDAATAGGDKSAHRAWKSLDRAFGKKSKGGLAGDIGKLALASKSSNSVLVADGNLRALLDTAIAAADQALAGSPEEVAKLIGQIRLQKDRDKVLAHVTKANDLRLEGATAKDSGDEAGQLRQWKKANAAFARATALAKGIIRKQGGPLPQFKTAQAGRVYTVVGQGEGGFNGDGHDARRTQLYFVEECRVGPDGLLYILDWNNHMVRRRTTDGRIERICGSGIPGDSEGAAMATDLNHPSSLVFEPTLDGSLGKIYLAAWHNHKVKVYDPQGGAGGNPAVYTIAGTTQGGGGSTSGDGGLATNAKFNLLPGVVRLPSGDLIACDAANAVLRKVTLNPGTTAPNLVGTMVHTGQVDLFAGTRGSAGISGDGGSALACTLNFSKAQNAEPDGRMELSPDATKLYVICGQGNCVRVVDLTANPPTISRFAGTGVAGYSGDGGPAVSAQLNRPSDIAVAADGTVFISDSSNNVIRRVAPNGTISTYAGADITGGAAEDDVAVAAAKFHHPAGLELDASGNLYVCDRENSVIRVITSADPGTGLVLPVAPYVIPSGSRGGPPAKGPSGTIDTYAGRTPDAAGLATDVQFQSGIHLGFGGDGRPSLDTDLYWPQDVAVDPSSVTPLLHIVDWNNHRVRRIENDGTITTVVGSGRLGDEGGEGPDAKMNHPTDITFHPVTGELWIAGWHTDKVLRLDASSNLLMYMAGNKRAFSGDGGVASNPASGSPTAGVAELNLPSSVKFTGNGDWYVADEGNQRIRRVDAVTDIINTIAGDGTQGFAGDGGPAASATFNLPVGQAAQPAGRLCISPDERWLYIADTNNNRVRRIDLADVNRTITTFAGNGTAGYSGDGSLAKDAALNFPCDVDCDGQGNVFIADRDNNVIRRVDATSGVITTIAGTGASGYGGDRGNAKLAWLQKPCGIFVVRSGAAAGRIYVADTYNGIVRVIWE